MSEICGLVMAVLDSCLPRDWLPATRRRHEAPSAEGLNRSGFDMCALGWFRQAARA